MKCVVLLALVFICKAFGQCPASTRLNCYLYELGNQDCNRQQTFFEVDGTRCEGCNMCIPELTAEGGCPNVQCPYTDTVYEIARRRCRVVVHQMKINVNGRTCNACDIAAQYCSHLSFIGHGMFAPRGTTWAWPTNSTVE